MSFLPSHDQRYLDAKGFDYQEVSDGKRRGLILPDWVLPDTRYDQARANLLILIPSGYSDVPPDMFHLDPWVRLATGLKYPGRADVPVEFAGRRWQRWSRHNNEWRRGKDGIWTMLKRVQYALEIAQ